MIINSLLKEWREEAAKQPAGNLQETKKAVVKAVFNKVVDGMPATNLKQAKSKVRAKQAVTAKENPGDKYRPDPLGDFQVFGATGLNGDGYALEEGNCGAKGYQEGGEVKPCDKCKKCGEGKCGCAKNMKEWMSNSGLI